MSTSPIELDIPLVWELCLPWFRIPSAKPDTELADKD